MGFLWRGDYVIIIKMMCAVKNGILGFTARLTQTRKIREE